MWSGLVWFIGKYEWRRRGATAPRCAVETHQYSVGQSKSVFLYASVQRWRDLKIMSCKIMYLPEKTEARQTFVGIIWYFLSPACWLPCVLLVSPHRLLFFWSGCGAQRQTFILYFFMFSCFYLSVLLCLPRISWVLHTCFLFLISRLPFSVFSPLRFVFLCISHCLPHSLFLAISVYLYSLSLSHTYVHFHILVCILLCCISLETYEGLISNHTALLELWIYTVMCALLHSWHYYIAWFKYATLLLLYTFFHTIPRIKGEREEGGAGSPVFASRFHTVYVFSKKVQTKKDGT